MTKKIAILLLLVFLSCNALWADNFWGFDSKGASIAMDIITIAVGGGMAAVPSFVSGLNESPYNYIMYGVGGGFALIGLIGLIYDCTTSDSNYYAMANPILEHVVLNVSRKTVYVGGTWRF
jgi:hypothetical protein